jgi:hypothetical protein
MIQGELKIIREDSVPVHAMYNQFLMKSPGIGLVAGQQKTLNL